ncbi:hypothetical protein GCM10010269_19820 [Streptomyces humidus]|uniref:Uncharacterized protein n=1 Tax=Streptomyces humidus TaxID=52259 RepID=A0A918FT49_9ACTN|nr:hypothetical protein [Streptomyces humidus]GGR80719.1 hypothetical protein GCM10010269_19820 [Streptomyces humidus]
MTPDRAYATARQLIDPDADYTVHVRTDTGWTQPADPDHRELPGLDVLLAARRLLRARPAGHVGSTHPDTLDMHTGDGRLWLRFTATTLGDNDPGPAEPAADERAPQGLWRLLGLSGSSLAPLARCDLTDSDLVTLARTCLTLSRAHPLPQPGMPPEAALLLERLASSTEALDSGLPSAPDIDDDFSRTELLTLADTALALYRTHGDPNDLLGRPEVLLLAHLAYDDTPP